MRIPRFGFLGSLLLAGCAGPNAIHPDTTLGRVVVYKSGVAYFERYASIDDDRLRLAVPAAQMDDFLKSLTVVDEKTGAPAPIAYPRQSSGGSGLVELEIGLSGARPHRLKLSYVTEAPAWKPTYRAVLGRGGKVSFEGWAIVDNDSGEDWKQVKLGVGSSSALSFRFDLQSRRPVEREELTPSDRFAVAPPVGESPYGGERAGAPGVVGDVAAGPPQAPEIAVGRIESARARVDEQVAAARLQRDTVKILCLSDKATQLEALVRSARERRRAIDAGGDPAVIEHDRAALTVQKERGDRLLAEAQQCIGEESAFVGETAVTTAISPDLPPDEDENLAQAAKRRRDAAEQPAAGPPPAPKPARPRRPPGAARGAGAATQALAEPIGASHFEAPAPLTIARGSSAMISILKAETEGEVVYLYDPESERGNVTFPFRAVRLTNPTDSTLESGPVTVFGDGRFVGEGLCEPIPAHSVGFVPFALDRQVVADARTSEADGPARVVGAERGLLTTELEHVRRTVVTLNNRLREPATVFVRHTVAQGYALGRAPESRERAGGAYLFKVSVPALGKVDVEIEDASSLVRTSDVRAPEGLAAARAYLAAASPGPLRDKLGEVVKLAEEASAEEQGIAATRARLGDERRRADRLRAQIAALRASRTSGPLLAPLDRKLEELDRRLTRSTLDLVALDERLAVLRVRIDDAAEDLRLDRPTTSGLSSAARSR